VINESTLKKIEGAQKNEITEHLIYQKLSEREKDEKNKKVLLNISKDELSHYNVWKKYTKKEFGPNKLKVFLYYIISLFFGLTFGIKLMERGEVHASQFYKDISKDVPESKKISEEEDEHENKLISMIKEEKLEYVGSIVLGLNDALVELTGTLAGLSFALQNTRLTALAGLITGIAASLSMAASEYLSSKEDNGKNPFKSSIYTGITYIFTVALLVLPFLLFSSILVALGTTIIIAVVIIFLFTYYISVAKDLNFRKRFLEMVIISLSVAAISFALGLLAKILLGVSA